MSPDARFHGLPLLEEISEDVVRDSRCVFWSTAIAQEHRQGNPWLIGRRESDKPAVSGQFSGRVWYSVSGGSDLTPHFEAGHRGELRSPIEVRTCGGCSTPGRVNHALAHDAQVARVNR